MIRTVIKTLLIGCGSIGATKDDKFDSPITENVLTHAHALYNDAAFQLHTIVDRDIETLREAYQKWKPELMTRFTSYALEDKFDLVVVATPTKLHLGIVKEILESEHKPKMILLEKPAGDCYSDCMSIKEMADRAGVLVGVHYNRRFELFHKMFYRHVDDVVRLGGEIYSCIVKYGRGSVHDGCHAMDLMNWWFGIIDGGVKFKGTKEDGFDESYKMYLRFEKCDNVIWIPVDSKKYGIFEIEVTDTSGIYTFKDNGLLLEIRQPKVDGVYGDYQSIGDRESHKTRLTTALQTLYNDIQLSVNGDISFPCTIDNALDVWDAYGKINGEE